MRDLTRRLAPAVAALALLAHSAAFGDTIVAPNANAGTSGSGQQYGVLGSGAVTFQFAYDASQLSGISSGSTIDGIGFRLPARADTFPTTLSYSQFSIDVATAALPVGSLSTTFASNVSADDTVVRSGALSIPGGSFVGGSNPNPFFEIVFTPPFVYQGGALVVTIRHSAPGQDGPPVDANTIPTPLPLTIGNSVANFGSATETTGQAGYFDVPITSFYFTPSGGAVPEPASVVSSGTAVVMMVLGFAWRHRRRDAA